MWFCLFVCHSVNRLAPKQCMDRYEDNFMNELPLEPGRNYSTLVQFDGWIDSCQSATLNVFLIIRSIHEINWHPRTVDGIRHILYIHVIVIQVEIFKCLSMTYTSVKCKTLNVHYWWCKLPFMYQTQKWQKWRHNHFLLQCWQ